MPFDSLAKYTDLGTDARGRPQLRLDEDLVFRNTFDGGGQTVLVPRGFVTNLASTPRILWCLFPPFGRWNRAAIVHDFLCTKVDTCSRFMADAVFREAMAQLGVPLWRRVAMYYAVRLDAALTMKK